ncbi:MAG: transglycosylase family protein, partial [Nitriliruptorales bacterium]|nr:transglycosylase family protein [Nitriliruptorales bacterium]
MLTVGIATALAVAVGATADDTPKTYPQHDPQFQAANLKVEAAPLPTLDPAVRDDSLSARAEYAAARHQAELEAAKAHAEWHAEQERKQRQQEQQQQASSAPAQASGSVWDRLAQCESGGTWSYNGSSGFDGGL